ncbi:glycosyltransferase [Frigidibacter sp. MR17.14]|uniref:glycosyltransferase family 2 protein n=1 Tax=Frigidibacter sp. MR17.14 TaxID=3126509 RepID=UPI003012B087
MSAPDVSVILPLYNDRETLPAVLAALAAQRTARRVEVIVVDDGSTDGGPALVAAPVRLVTQANAGPAAARNRGAEAAGGALLLFLDSDCVPPPDWIERMAAAVTGRFDAVMGTIRAANDGVVPRLVQLEVEDRYRGMAAATGGVDFIAAPACGVRAEVFRALGGFDARLRTAEDVEFAYRLTAAGHRIAFTDRVPVAHAHQRTWGQFLRAKHQRALGRLRVFALFPAKMRRDSWTPLSLKLQFACVALALALALPALALPPVGPLLVAALLASAVALGWPLVRATARAERSLIGYGPGLAVGAAFVLLRAAVILLALVQLRLGRRHRTAAPPARAAAE